MDEPRGAKPGWYRDAKMVNTQRFWDGEKWTDQTQPASPDPAPGVARGVLTAVAVVALLVLAGWFIYAVAHANDDLDCATRNADHAAQGEPAEDCGN